MSTNSVCGIPLNYPLPDDVILVDAVVILKALDKNGKARVIARATGSLPVFEALGMVEIAKKRLMDGLEQERGNHE